MAQTWRRGGGGEGYTGEETDEAERGFGRLNLDKDGELRAKGNKAQVPFQEEKGGRKGGRQFKGKGNTRSKLTLGGQEKKP